MIKTLSTYYLSVPFVSPLTGETCTEYKVRIYIWTGAKTSPPVDPEYEITKENIESSTGTDKIKIGRLIDDFISFSPSNSAIMELIAGSGQAWCKTSVEYTTADPTDTGVEQLQTTTLALKGYGFGYEGENPQPRTDKILIDKNLYRVSRNSRTSIPVLLDAPMTGTVKSYPLNEIDFSFSELTQTDSATIVKLINIPSPENDDYIEVKIGVRTITLIIKDEFKYSPVDVYFLNKEGAQQTLTFFKERRDSLNVTRENYESIAGQPADGFHQYPDFNINGRTSVVLTSGYVPETENSSFKELLLSSEVFIWDGTWFIPVNVSSSDIEYLTRVNDRLISYDIEFKYSFSEINNI